MPEKQKYIDNPFYKGFYGSEELAGMGFGAVGKNVKIAKGCTIIGLENISLGSNIQIDEQVFIAANRGSLVIGDYVHIGGGSHVSCAGGVTISDFCGLSQGVRVYSATDDYTGHSLTNTTVPEQYKSLSVSPVKLERHVLIGSGSVVLPGVTIGEGSAVGALSLVSMSLDEWGVYFGAPAKRIKVRSKKLLEMEKLLLREEGGRKY